MGRNGGCICFRSLFVTAARMFERKVSALCEQSCAWFDCPSAESTRAKSRSARQHLAFELREKTGVAISPQYCSRGNNPSEFVRLFRISCSSLFQFVACALRKFVSRVSQK